MTVTAQVFHLNGVWLARCLVIGIVISMTKAFALTNFLEFLLVMVCFTHRQVRSAVVKASSDLRVMITMGFWLWVMISVTWADVSLAASLDDFVSWRKLILVPICFALFQDRASKLMLISSLVAISSVFLLWSWFELAFGSRELAPRVLENHATQGILFSVSAFFLLIFSSDIGPRRIWSACLLALSMAFALNVIFVSEGRSGYLWFVILATSAFLQIAPRRRRWLWAPVISILVMGSLFLSPVATERVGIALIEVKETLTNPHAKDSSLGTRIVMWEHTLEVISDSPILGSGAGAFAKAYGDRVDDLGGWRGRGTDDPHQQYLLIAGEYGLIGLLIFLCSLTLWMFSAPTRGYDDKFLFCAKAILVCALASGMANGHFGTFVEGRLVWIFLAGLAAGSIFPSPTMKDGQKGSSGIVE